MADAERRSIDLAEITADGWFQQLASELTEYEELARAIGERFVGFAFIAGVRVTAVALDTTTPEASIVDFVLGESDQVQQLALGDFRERLAAALIARDDDEPALPDTADDSDAQTYIGHRRLLLAALFGIRLLSLQHGGSHHPTITLSLGTVEEELSLDGLHEILDNAVRSELSRVRPQQPFSIDFKRVPKAEQANRDGDYDETIALLGSWPGPLSMFLRTPQGQALGTPERTKLVRALGALGRAYIEKGQVDWAEDVLRLGIQFGQELAETGLLFAELGRTRTVTGRPGEAIGLYRRALSLGREPVLVLPALAAAFAERGRYVAALGCLSQAEGLGADDGELSAIRQQVQDALGDAYVAYRNLMSAPEPA